MKGIIRHSNYTNTLLLIWRHSYYYEDIDINMKTFLLFWRHCFNMKTFFKVLSNYYAVIDYSPVHSLCLMTTHFLCCILELHFCCFLLVLLINMLLLSKCTCWCDSSSYWNMQAFNVHFSSKAVNMLIIIIYFILPISR